MVRAEIRVSVKGQVNLIDVETSAEEGTCGLGRGTGFRCRQDAH